MANLKQGTLSFASSKRTNAISSGKSQQKALISEKGKRKRVETPAESKSDAALASEVLEIPSDEEDTVETAVPTKRTRASTTGRTPSKAKRQAGVLPAKQTPPPTGIERECLDVEDNAGRYRKYYNDVRAKMGYIPPIHGEGQNKIHQMLRFFDMSYEYGPCIGMTRLERWERADRFGLDPPVEVRDILLTTEGIEKAEYAQCVLNDEV